VFDYLVVIDVVTFLGVFTDSSQKKYLVFEYLPRGSLDKVLNEEKEKLTMGELLDMAIGSHY
jgi:serine/threonine protein kinase